MFFDTESYRHGLPRDPFLSTLVPRPIGWISTLTKTGVPNLAPYSFFNGVSEEPPMVMFATNGRANKDTIRNARDTGEFVVNLATWDLRHEMNLTATPHPYGVDEMALAGLEAEPSQLVKPPRIKASPIHLECVFHSRIDLPSTDPKVENAICIGRVVGIHIRDEVLKDGLIDLSRVRPIGRLGYMQYVSVDTIFELPRHPGHD